MKAEEARALSDPAKSEKLAAELKDIYFQIEREARGLKRRLTISRRLDQFIITQLRSDEYNIDITEDRNCLFTTISW